MRSTSNLLSDSFEDLEYTAAKKNFSVKRSIYKCFFLTIFTGLVTVFGFVAIHGPEDLIAVRRKALSVANVAHSSTEFEDGSKALFDDFISSYGKIYSSESEYWTRLDIFKKNLVIIRSRNAQEIASGGSAVHGITSFADYSQKEIDAVSTLLPPKYHTPQSYQEMVQLQPTAATFSDWRTSYVTAIKNQGKCGSCWAYAATEQIESDAIRLLKGFDPSLNLSPQQLVDCDRADHACSGGWMPTAWDYVKGTGGVEFASDYPQTDKNKTCASNSGKYIVGVSGYTGYYNNEAWMQNYVLSTGPIAACFYGVDLTSYTGGIITSCPSTACTHAIQLVGLNTASSPPYWIVSLIYLSTSM